MSTDNYNNNNNQSMSYDAGTSMLTDRKLRLSVYMTLLLCAVVPSCMAYGHAIDIDQCPTDDENSRDCNAMAAGFYILLLMIIICGLFMWIIPNSNIMDNKVAKICIGILFLIAGIMIFVGVMLSYDQYCSADTSNNSICLMYIGTEWFIITHVLLLSIDIITDYGSEISKRLLSYSLMYLIGCCILFEPVFESDNPSEQLEVIRAGLVLIFIGCIVVLICCIINITQKRTISSNDAGKWFTRILALFFIGGAILFLHSFDGIIFTLSSTFGLLWIILIGLIIHGYDVVSM